MDVTIELQTALEKAYEEYYRRMQKSKCHIVWTYKDWLNHSKIAEQIIQNNYTPEKPA